jgi:hypothetical protein
MIMRPFALAAALLAGCSDQNLNYITDASPGGEEETLGDPETDEVTDEVVDEEDDCEDEEGVVLDMDAISTLQDAFGLASVRDGLSLQGPEGADEGWRPTTVEAQVMLPSWYFDWYDDENSITVTIYEGAEPTGNPWVLTQQVRKADLDWAPLQLPADADWSGDDRDQIAAWMTFDFSDQIEPGEFQDGNFFVAVGWDDLGYPNVGYSNFEMPCASNWTDYGDGYWKQNSGQDCSWPMMRISHERTVIDECE